jgi:serine/threonine protein kinase
LTGKSPFLGKNYHDTLAKNQRGVVQFDDKDWKNLRPEARDLVSRMVAVRPAERLTAHEALAHAWFHEEAKVPLMLATACENMMKYNDKARFNLEKIKPEFSMVTCTPLMSARNGGSGVHDSPLMQPQGRPTNPFYAHSPAPVPSSFQQRDEGRAPVGETPVNQGIKMRNIRQKYAPAPAAQSRFKKNHEEEEAADFNDEEIDEGEDNKYTSHYARSANPSFVSHKGARPPLPQTPSHNNRASLRCMSSSGVHAPSDHGKGRPSKGCSLFKPAVESADNSPANILKGTAMDSSAAEASHKELAEDCKADPFVMKEGSLVQSPNRHFPRKERVPPKSQFTTALPDGPPDGSTLKPPGTIVGKEPLTKAGSVRALLQGHV